ncbi:MAG: phosphatidylserine decarboxylase [archaeon]
MLARGSSVIIIPVLALTASIGLAYYAFQTAISRYIFWLSFAFLCFTIYFFRDPERRIKKIPGLLSPTDGTVVSVSKNRISVFLSPFNVHISRMPCDGKVLKISYQRGTFAPAFSKKSSENEREAITLKTKSGNLKIERFAGILARRIVTWVSENDTLSQGQRFGMIRFGSRCDVTLPPRLKPKVSKGDKLKAGISVIAGA